MRSLALLVGCALALGAAVGYAEPQPRAATGTVRVLCDVQADAYLDGVAKGPTPAEIKDVREGEHVVQVRAAGYAGDTRRVIVKAGETVIVRFELRGHPRAVGRLRVLSTPAGANVLVGGARAGKTPYDGELEPGEVVVRIYLPGFGSFEQTVTIEAGKVTTISRELVPRR